MLKRLSIQNYAIIDKLEIDFSVKLNVITGETGAGKSIIVGALGLILGARADTDVLLNREKKCIVEGFFAADQKKTVKKFLKVHDFDIHEELMIRREIGTNGKSRAFINDTPVTLNQLQQLSSLLVDLHQQFDALELGESGFQRQVLDALADHAEKITEYQDIYNRWQYVKKETEELKQQKLQFDKELDYNLFQFNELEEAAFEENELEDLDAELKMLSNSEGIKAGMANIHFQLTEGDTPVVHQLKNLLHQLQAYSAYHPDLLVLVQRLQSAQIELHDIADEVDGISARINHDPEKIEQINERLSLGYRLQKKHGVKTTNDLLKIKKQLEEKLQVVLNIDEAIKQKEKETEEYYQQAIKLSVIISEGRKKQIKPLENTVNKLLARVGMPNARLLVETQYLASLQAFGSDNIEFLFDANVPAVQQDKSNQFQPLRKVASGGELSRLMLCIKSLVAQSIDLPTLIFDEIDTGISGEVARQVGVMMKDLAATRQLICITHQPQIAGKADAHFFVYKEIKGNAVKTNIRQLTQEERITAIAKMLSGGKPTAAALENAREMVMN